MNKEITIDGIVYVQKEVNKNIQIIPEQRLEWGNVCEKELNWNDAKKWCEEQGEGWRLPTQIELLQAYYNKVDGFSNICYWSSSESSVTGARSVDFNDGNSSYTNKNSNYSVRCVRGLIK